MARVHVGRGKTEANPVKLEVLMTKEEAKRLADWDLTGNSFKAAVTVCLEEMLSNNAGCGRPKVTI
jgi:GH24 family phage-related lysozyme (muramidase)